MNTKPGQSEPDNTTNEALVAELLRLARLYRDQWNIYSAMRNAAARICTQAKELERLRAKLKAISSECADGHLSAKEAVANIERILGEGGTA